MFAEECIDTKRMATPAASALSWRGWLAIGVRKLAVDGIRCNDWLLACRDRARQRAVLARLDERMLQDIGVGRHAVCRELRKPSWRA